MYLTMEVRWFYPGAFPGHLLDQLDEAGCLPPAQVPRQDHYLRLPAQQTLSIKLREGNIEVKTRLGDAGEGHLGPQAIGVLGLWRKWSFPLALSAVSWATPGADLEGEREVTSGVPALERWLVPGSAWISVEKERRLQRYRLSGDMAATAVPMGTPTGLGCEFELSRLRAGGEEWWSVCFEAFGSEPGLERALMAVATQVLGLGWPLPLDVEHSLSYPSWLACFAARVEPPNH